MLLFMVVMVTIVTAQSADKVGMPLHYTEPLSPQDGGIDVTYSLDTSDGNNNEKIGLLINSLDGLGVLTDDGTNCFSLDKIVKSPLTEIKPTSENEKVWRVSISLYIKELSNAGSHTGSGSEPRYEKSVSGNSGMASVCQASPRLSENNEGDVTSVRDANVTDMHGNNSIILLEPNKENVNSGGNVSGVINTEDSGEVTKTKAVPTESGRSHFINH